MKYEKFNPEIHDPDKIAALIYDVDFRTFNLIFKSKDKAVNAIKKNLKNEKHLRVIMDNNNIAGILMCYDSDSIPKFHLKSLRLFVIDILDFFVLSDVKKGDLYIAELAIAESKRGQGRGRKVLTDVTEYASKNSYLRVTLDVDLRNEKARKLYEKAGFRKFNKKQLKIAGFKRGMYNMEFTFS